MTKNKQPKRRLLKVYSKSDRTPFIRFGGKYLTRELGFNCGDRFELTHDNDTITLRKLSQEEVAECELNEEQKAKLELIKELFPIGAGTNQPTPMLIAEPRTTTYSVIEEEINNHLKQYLES